ncbi:MAG TPA: hypothetical protein VLB90_02025 [Pseudomonadales bacterium]|nr:hypothetical protein [Pseudomonadales bacterium]
MKNITTRQAIFWLAIATPVVIHFILLHLYTVNAPRLDDFSEILTFLPDWHAAFGTDAKAAIFFRDYQNHRYVLYHALLIFFDHINFRTAAIVGNLPLILLCGLMMKCTASHPQKKILWLITPLLIFNLQTWRAMFWGPLGTTNLLYPAVGLFACWLATLGTRGVIAAGFTAVFLTLSHGSGPILFPVIAVYLWIEMRATRCSIDVCMSWILLSVITLLFYFVVFPLNREAGYSSHSSLEMLQILFTHVVDITKGVFAIVGSHLLYNDPAQPWKHMLAMTLGACELCWLGFLIWRGALRDSPALLLWLVFLLLAITSIAMGRVAYAGIDQAMQGHYKLLNGIVLWFLIVATLRWKPAGNALALVLAIALYVGGLLLFLIPMQTFQRALIDDVYQWQQTGKLESTETRLYVKQHNHKLKAAIDGGFYDPGE